MPERWLLRLYPRDWRERYGPEVSAMLAGETPSIRLTIDLLAGAIDAWFNPQSITKGAQMSTPLFRCVPVAVSRADAWKGNITIFGGTIAIAVLYIAGRHQFPAAKPYLDVLGYASFCVPVVMSSYWTYLKPYSRPARLVLIAAMSLAVLAILFAATALAVRL